MSSELDRTAPAQPASAPGPSSWTASERFSVAVAAEQSRLTALADGVQARWDRLPHAAPLLSALLVTMTRLQARHAQWWSAGAGTGAELAHLEDELQRSAELRRTAGERLASAGTLDGLQCIATEALPPRRNAQSV